MSNEQNWLVITFMRILLCYRGLLEAAAAALVLVLMRVISFSLFSNPSDRQQMIDDEPVNESTPPSTFNSQEIIDDEPVDELTVPSIFNEHDIFLSHSGKQKGFVNDLYKVLYSKGYSAFFDITHHSLPPGEKFPTIIMEAAANCKLALVVLSDDFLCSKWPMTELCAFVDAQSSSAEKQSIIRILPIFYKLSPSDLKLPQNCQKWRMAWEAFAKGDPARINVTKWEHALRTLGKLNGIIFDPSKSDGGELSYIQKILSSISKIVKPVIKYDMLHVRGGQRLCKIICDKFMELECGMPQPSNLTPTPEVCILGMYGLPGSGKSTLSKCLCNHYTRQFNGRTFYLELPANPTKEQLVEISKHLLKQVTDFSDMVDLDIATDLDQVYSLLRRYLQSSSVFLVVDNIMPHDLPIEFVQRILMCDFQAGSKVLLVGRVFHVLQRLCSHGEVQKKCREEKYKCVYRSVRVPSINKEEAIQVLLQSSKGGWLAESCALEDELDPKDQEIVETVIGMSGFVQNGNLEYLPMVVKIMGAELRDYNLEEWGNDMEAIWKKVQLGNVRLYKEEAVMILVKEIFDKLPQHLQILFLDVALFILPQSGASDRSAHMLAAEEYADEEEREEYETRRSRFAGKDVLVGCPNLKSVRILGACFEDGLGTVIPSMLQKLELGSFWHAESFPDLPKATKSLKFLRAWDCRQLRHVNFMHQFEVLERVILEDCPSLMQVDGLDLLVSLRHLSICRCAKLQTVSGLSGLVRLEEFEVVACDSLERLSLEELVSLKEFRVGEGCSKLQMLHTDLLHLTQLVWLEYYQHAFLPGVLQLSNFVTLESLRVYFNNDAMNSTGTSVLIISLENLPSLKSLYIRPYKKKVKRYEEREMVTQLVDVATLLGLSHLSNLLSISKLSIEGVLNLASLNGITFLLPLVNLTLKDLPNLTSLSGIETLIRLKVLIIEDCESIEELPSLSLMLELEELHLENCSKLKSLDGCNASQRLREVWLTGCKEMGHFPLSDTSRLESLEIHGSKFASIDTLVQWVVVPPSIVLCQASLSALGWEFCHNFYEAEAQMILGKVVLETVGVELINRLIPNDDDCFDFIAWADTMLERLQNESLVDENFVSITHEGKLLGELRLLVDENFVSMTHEVKLLGELSSKSKRWLKEQCQFNTLFKEHVIACLAATDPWLLENVLLKSVCDSFYS